MPTQDFENFFLQINDPPPFLLLGWIYNRRQLESSYPLHPNVIDKKDNKEPVIIFGRDDGWRENGGIKNFLPHHFLLEQNFIYPAIEK